jgi:acetyl esterase/lipase
MGAFQQGWRRTLLEDFRKRLDFLPRLCDDDRNAPFRETVTLVGALRKQGVEFDELIFPDEVHDFLLYAHWVEAYRASAEFLKRKLGK